MRQTGVLAVAFAVARHMPHKVAGYPTVLQVRAGRALLLLRVPHGQTAVLPAGPRLEAWGAVSPGCSGCRQPPGPCRTGVSVSLWLGPLTS